MRQSDAPSGSAAIQSKNRAHDLPRVPRAEQRRRQEAIQVPPRLEDGDRHEAVELPPRQGEEPAQDGDAAAGR